jgi:hypothetical protein
MSSHMNGGINDSVFLDSVTEPLKERIAELEAQINAMHRENIASQERLAAALLKSHKETETDMLALANLRNFIP